MSTASTLRPQDYFSIGLVISLFATIHVGLRLWCRKVIGVQYGLDDLWCVAAWVVLMALNISTGYLYLGGHLEEPTSQISPEDLDLVLRSWYADHLLYFVCMLFCKLTAIFFYLRLFTTKTFRIAAATVTFLCVVTFLGGMIPFAVQCQPTSVMVAPEDPDTCFNLPQLFNGINLTNLFTNIFVLALPLPFVWNLNLSLRQRFALTGVFLMGGIACLISLIRTLLQDEWLVDFDTMVGDCSLFTVLEPAVCLFAACLPALRPLIPKCGPVQTAPAPTPFRASTVLEPGDQLRNNSWDTDKISTDSSNLAYAEKSYSPNGAYVRAYNGLRSSYHPGRQSMEPLTRPPRQLGTWSDGTSSEGARSDEPPTPPRGIMVRSDVYVVGGRRY